ncbi:hypothetical protein TNCV_32101 [Trichonephila clavipes]|nr:hypothetical protein TNCV_32101 [Trichonephila clavipes]
MYLKKEVNPLVIYGFDRRKCIRHEIQSTLSDGQRFECGSEVWLKKLVFVTMSQGNTYRLAQLKFNGDKKR